MTTRAFATLTLVGILAIGLLVALGSGVDAKDEAEFLPAFGAAYPDARGSRIDTCFLCHYTVSEDDEVEYKKNDFAKQWKEADESFPSVEGQDADGDGFTNLQEILAHTFPGDPSDNPDTVVTTTTAPGATTTTAAPGSGAAIYANNCASCHGASGGNLVPTSLTLAQLINVTTNGAGGMPGFSGSLTSADIQAVSEYLFNWSAAATTTTTTAPVTGTTVPPNGSALYASTCSACHGANGGDLVSSTLSHTQLVAVTADGRGTMPPFSGSLSAAEIEAIISYVEGQSSPVTTTTAVGSPAPDGATIWANSCAACHGASGGDLIGTSLSKSQIASITANGSGSMPGFSTRLGVAEIDAVAAYVSSLSGAAPTTTTTTPGAPLPSGTSVFSEFCAACHGSGGGDLVGHSLSNSELRSVTNNGQGSMPGFASRLSTEQVDAVVSYVSGLGAASSTESTGDSGVDGGSLYTSYCSACHGAHGAGGSGGAVAGTSLSRSELISITTDGRSGMPSYAGRLSGEEIGAVADFILGMSGSTAAEDDSTVVGANAPGADLYAELCAGCHGDGGEGGLGGAILGHEFDSAELEALLRNGSGAMPAYPTLSDGEITDLVSYTQRLAAGEFVAEAPVDEPTNQTSDGDSGGSALSMFADGGGDTPPGKSPFIVGSLLVGLVSIVLAVVVMWFRSARVLAE